MERYKRQFYFNLHVNNYFWRTWDQQEIDLVEEQAGQLSGFEIKWQSKKVRVPKDWQQTYKDATFSVIHKDNFLEFVL